MKGYNKIFQNRETNMQKHQIKKSCSKIYPYLKYVKL